MAAWTGCIAGALTEAEFRAALTAAGLEEIEIRETHRVHEHAAAAIIRARSGGAASPAGYGSRAPIRQGIRCSPPTSTGQSALGPGTPALRVWMRAADPA